MKLYYKDELIAVDKEINGHRALCLLPTATRYPIDLFGYKDNFKSVVSTLKVGDWAEVRACPKGRIGIKDILNDLGMERYSALDIAIANDFQTFYDDYRLEFGK